MSNLHKPLSGVVSGERQGSATAVQLPTVSGSLIYITALVSNAGNVYIGAAGVTVPNGTTDVTSGLELTPGTMVGPLPLDNLNRLFMICDNATDDVTYLVLA
jgi:hypothetical protein